ncbi:MAG: hypothetical protein II956_04640 [Bacteroidales bacterium]|nr:hypothetical protein [Bacteroidales bacterium]
MKLKFSILLVFVCLVSYNAKAQTVKATLDSNIVEFGNPVRLTITANVNSGQKTYFPNFKNGKITDVLELITELKPDTAVSQDRKQVTFTHTYLITSFKDTALYVPQLKIRVGGDTLLTDSLKLTFTLLQGVDSTFTAEIDTTKTMKIFDIVPVKETPWTFEEFWARFSKLILILLIVAVLASIATYMYIRWKNNKPIIPVLKPKEPADKVALRELQKLKDGKLWQQGRTKEYYSVLTEILKRYISDRYGNSVMEMTSDETLKSLKNDLAEKEESYQGLKFIFGIADFVKFAKLEPLPDENDNSMSYAFKFVEMTKKVPVAAENGDEVKKV